jgi:hypothetical protein
MLALVITLSTLSGTSSSHFCFSGQLTENTTHNFLITSRCTLFKQSEFLFQLYLLASIFMLIALITLIGQLKTFLSMNTTFNICVYNYWATLFFCVRRLLKIASNALIKPLISSILSFSTCGLYIQNKWSK